MSMIDMCEIIQILGILLPNNEQVFTNNPACSGPCELCVNHGHCSTRFSENAFQLDMDKWKPIMENWWNINVAETLKRELRLDQEDELRKRHETEFEDCKPSDVCCSSCVYGTMTRMDGPCGGVYKQASIEMLKSRLHTLGLNEEQIAHIQQLCGIGT